MRMAWTASLAFAATTACVSPSAATVSMPIAPPSLYAEPLNAVPAATSTGAPGSEFITIFFDTPSEPGEPGAGSDRMALAPSGIPILLPFGRDRADAPAWSRPVPAVVSPGCIAYQNSRVSVPLPPA